jgi:cell division protein FtsI (penicillin-binding protein 3)
MYNKKGKINKPDSHIPWRNKGFYFEDYETSKYEYKNQSKFSEVKLSLNRVSFIFFIFLVVAFVFGSKIIYLASIKKGNYFTNKSLPSVFLRRQDILDRNNNLLARNVKLYSAAIRPQFITDEGKLLINLRLIFPNMNMDRIKKKNKSWKILLYKKKIK